MLARLVPENGQRVPVVGDSVEAERIPFRWHERVDLDGLVGTRAQADEPADDEVAIGRVVVILATLLAAFAGVPGAILPCLQTRS